jgi:hypothetical protein
MLIQRALNLHDSFLCRLFTHTVVLRINPVQYGLPKVELADSTLFPVICIKDPNMDSDKLNSWSKVQQAVRIQCSDSHRSEPNVKV